MRPLVALSSYSSAQTPQWKSVTVELAAKAVRGVAPQPGQKALATTQPSLRTRAFDVDSLKTA